MNKLFGKNNLDELQEQKMLHIEKICFWALYWMLFGEMMLQIVFGDDPASVVGEGVCFLAASVLMVGLCLKNNLWDRRLKADRKTNLAVSLIAAAAVALINGIGFGLRLGTEAKLWEAAVAAALSAAVTFLLTCGSLTALTSLYKRRVRKQEEAEEEE